MQLPEKKYIASFDIDAQNTFTPVCPDELPVAEGDTIAPELNAQAQFASLRPRPRPQAKRTPRRNALRSIAKWIVSD